MPISFTVPSDLQGKATLLVLEERARQDNKWGVQRHAPETWLPILLEEIGEMSAAMLGDGVYVEELIQVAAVSLAMLENIIDKPVFVVTNPVSQEVAS